LGGAKPGDLLPRAITLRQWYSRRRGSARSRRDFGRGNARVFLLLLDLAKARDVLEVLVVGFGKDMPAGAVGDEEHLLGARRIGGGLDRGAAWIGDRPGRQAVDDVGVVGGGRVLFALGDGMAERHLAAD